MAANGSDLRPLSKPQRFFDIDAKVVARALFRMTKENLHSA